MKYGLRSDKLHSSKLNWKISMENDVAALKAEVSTLKQQLKSSMDLVNLLLHKNSVESTVKECRQCQIKKNESDNIKSNDHKYVEFKVKAPVEIKLQHTMSSKAAPAPWLSITPSFSTRYKATPIKEDSDFQNNLQQLSCITTMPEYIDWSMEELRVSFYKAAYQNNNQLFYNEDLKNVLTGTGIIKYAPTWDYDPISKRSVCINCISMLPCYQTKSLEELRLEDYILREITPPKQNYPAKDSQMQKLSVENSQMQEELLNKITSQLGKMDTKLTSVTNHISTVDANVREIRSKISVMDSRLSAVDMFVTMKRMNKNWQGLTSRLQSLETASEIAESPTKKQITIVPSCSIQNNTSQSSSSTKKTSSIFDEEIKSTETKCTAKNHPDLSPQIFIATEDTILMNHIPKNSETKLLKESDEIKKTHSLNVNPNTIVCLEETVQEENKLSSLVEKSESPLLQDTELNGPPKNNIELDAKNSDSDTIQTVNRTLSSSKPDSHVLNDSTFQPDCHQEGEFVFVNKSDIDDLCDQSINENNSSTCSDSSTDYKMCNNITEYLEVNLGKSKNLVYEFGFEAKPDCLVDSVNTSYSCYSQETRPNVSGIKDDSFLSYIENLMESKSEIRQQSTPASSKQISKTSIEKLSVSKDAGN